MQRLYLESNDLSKKCDGSSEMWGRFTNDLEGRNKYIQMNRNKHLL